MTEIDLLRACFVLIGLGLVLLVWLIWCNSGPTKSRDADFRRFMDRNIPPRKRQ